MDQDFVETETGADMVPIRVSLQHAGMPRRERGNETGEVSSTCTCIQHRNIAAAFNEVALDVLAMMRLANHGHRVRKSPYVEPSSIRKVIHAGYHVQPTDALSRRSCPAAKIRLPHSFESSSSSLPLRHPFPFGAARYRTRRCPSWFSRHCGLLVEPSHQTGQLLIVELAEKRLRWG